MYPRQFGEALLGIRAKMRLIASHCLATSEVKFLNAEKQSTRLHQQEQVYKEQG